MHVHESLVKRAQCIKYVLPSASSFQHALYCIAFSQIVDIMNQCRFLYAQVFCESNLNKAFTGNVADAQESLLLPYEYLVFSTLLNVVTCIFLWFALFSIGTTTLPLP